MKKIKSEGAVKSKTPYRMKFIKKVATIASAVVLSAALFVGAAFTLTGCNNEKDPIDPNPPIVDPIPDPEPDPDPDPEPEPEPEPDPDPDPDPNPDPNPDPDPEPEPEPDPMPEYDEIDTIEELYGTEAPVLEEFTEEEYGSNYKEFYNNEVREYNEAQDKQAKIYETLNSTLLDNMIERAQGKGSSITVEDIADVKWEINTLEDGKTIKSIRGRYIYDDPNYTGYNVQTVTTTDELTLSDLYEPNIEKLEDAFTVGNPFNPKASYTSEHIFSAEQEDQTNNEDLLNAINEKIKTELTGDVQSFIKVDGSSVDSLLGGTANAYKILNVSDNGYEEYSINILDSSNGKTVIENLNNDDYHIYDEKSATYEDKFLDENSGKDHLEEIEIDKEQTQTKKSVKYVAKVSLPKEDGTFEEFEIEL